jgi:hypothetical protein
MFGELAVDKNKFILATQTVNYDTFNQAFTSAMPTVSGISVAAISLLASTLLW